MIDKMIFIDAYGIPANKYNLICQVCCVTQAHYDPHKCIQKKIATLRQAISQQLTAHNISSYAPRWLEKEVVLCHKGSIILASTNFSDS